MPKLKCCSGSDPWPEKLGAALLLEADDEGYACESVHYPLRWDGNAYVKDPPPPDYNGLDFTHRATPVCVQDEVVEMKHEVEVSRGPNCTLTREASEEVSCESPDCLVGWSDLPKECCQYSKVYSVLEISVWGSGAIPNEITPIEIPPPPCPSEVPPECCNQEGRVGSGGSSCGGSSCKPPMFSAAPVRYSSGSLKLEATDIRVDGFGTPWGHTRRFLNRLSHSEILGNGFNWQVLQFPYLVLQMDGNVGAFGVAETMLWFDESDGNFTVRFDLRYTLTKDEQAEEYELVRPDGTRVYFDLVTGRFLRWLSPDGHTIEVKTVSTSGYYPATVERSYASGGQTTTEQLSYEYDDSLGDWLLERVTLRRRVDAGSWENISRTSYTYYGFNETHGGEKDLETVKTETWTGSDWSETGTSYYRYHTWADSSSSSSSSSSGGDGTLPRHLLKYVLNPEAYAQLAADPTVSDPLTASDATVGQYADYYYEYDEDNRVTKELTNGGSQTYLLAYEESGNADGYNSWCHKTTETVPNGSQNIVYSNYAGQPMLRVLKSGSDQWCEFWEYNDQGLFVLHANPSAISGYDDTKADLLNKTGGSYQYLKSSDGLIHTYEYHAASGFVSMEKVKNGESGTAIKLREYEYISCAVGGSSSSSSSSSGGPGEPAVWFTSKETVYPSDTDQTKKIVTTYSYTFHSGTCQIKERVTTLPAVSTAQNGSGQSDTRREAFDTYGNRTWVMDERGFITKYQYDIPTGAITQMIQDVDTSQVSNEPAGWETPTGGGLHVVTDFEHDDRGRTTQTLGPLHTIDVGGVATSVRRATWTVYDDVNHEIRAAVGQAVPDAGAYTYTLINPVNIRKSDANGNTLEAIQAVRGSTTGKLLPTDTFAQTAYVAWTTHQYTECCVRSSTRVYHHIPPSGQGQSGVDYDQTDFEYNAMRVMNRQKTPGGTITFRVFDVRSQPTKVYIGTDDTGATTGDPTGGGATGNNMVLVTENEYDGGNDGDDGNLTEQTQHVDSTTTRVTEFTFEWRNRRTDTDGEIDFYQKAYFDNLGRVTKTERYDTTANGNLVARSETKYDDRGRIYQSIRYGVDPLTGTVGNSLTDNTWYDAVGNVLKSQPAGADLFTKNVYDGLGRRTKQYQGYDIDETSYADAGSITGDTIVEQTATSFDAASNAVTTTHRQRYHNATGTGSLGTPSSTQPKARVTYMATWQDAIGRTIATADYGTNGGTSLTRPSTVPGRSDNVLVTSLTYDSAGRMSAQTNPGAVRTCFEYDDAGRQVKQVLNCRGTSSSSSSSSGFPDSVDTNVTVRTAYNADGKVKSITAENAITGDQVTQYVYGTTLDDSEIASSHLKRAEIYPDSVDDYDRITFEYNRLGQVTETHDQQGTVHSFDYDALGRQTQDRVTTLGTAVDNAVRRIASTFEARGMREKLTSYDNATVGSGTVVNEVQFAYNDFGQITHDYQAHGGAVNTSTTPKVQYGYASGSDNTVRPTSITYPDGRVITYDYGTSGGMDDALSRVGSIVDNDLSSTHLADYSYLGLGPVRGWLPTVSHPLPLGEGRGEGLCIEADYTEPDIRWTMVGTAGGNDPDTGDIYRGFDRFSRVKDNYWYDYGSSTDVDRIKYGYDRNGNRIWRENTVAASYGMHFDELYGYDQIDRLQTMDRGDLDANKDAVSSLQFAQDWGLDSTGNWRGFREDDGGDGSWDLDQQRTANKVNEITDITEATGPTWVTPVYNRAGNMATIPKPDDPTASFTATYDAWNGLVKIEEGDDIVAEYVYDGERRRTIKKTYAFGSLDETRHFYYTEPARWQVVEERADTSSDANRQFVWGLRYVDDVVLRDRDTTENGTLDERLYGMQDANWNVTSIVDTAGRVQERCVYSAYGMSVALTATFGSVAASSFAWETRFSGYRWEEGSSLYYVRNRMYAAQLSVWLQRDPDQYARSPDLYVYADGNPLTYTDATGRGVVIIFILIGGVLLLAGCRNGAAPPVPPPLPLPYPTYPAPNDPSNTLKCVNVEDYYTSVLNQRPPGKTGQSMIPAGPPAAGGRWLPPNQGLCMGMCPACNEEKSTCQRCCDACRDIVLYNNDNIAISLTACYGTCELMV